MSKPVAIEADVVFPIHRKITSEHAPLLQTWCKADIVVLCLRIPAPHHRETQKHRDIRRRTTESISAGTGCQIA